MGNNTKHKTGKKGVCKHKHLVFLGKQEIPTGNGFLALFNCEDCRSTISLKMVSKGFKKRSPKLRKSA